MSEFQQFSERIRAALDREERQGVEYDSNRSYWRHTGQLVLLAVHIARRAIYAHVNAVEQTVDLPRAAQDLALAKRVYNAEHRDEDGFGAATFGRIIREILAIMEAQGRPYPKSYDELLAEVSCRDLDSAAAYRLTISPSMDEPITFFAAAEYKRCFDDILHDKIKKSSPASSSGLLRLALVAGMRANEFTRDSPFAERMLDIAAQDDPWEGLLTRLALGRATFADIGDRGRVPIDACAAHYWYGAALATQGSTTEALKEWVACLGYNLGCLECVLADIELKLRGIFIRAVPEEKKNLEGEVIGPNPATA